MSHRPIKDVRNPSGPDASSPNASPPPAAGIDGIEFESSYAELPDLFHTRVAPTPVRAPSLIRINARLAEELELDPGWLESDEGIGLLSGNRVPRGADPVAMAYAGHQFAAWVPQLGDGRAILLGERRDREGILRDLHLKGAGRTPYSRGGDGRSSIGPVVREYLASEAMSALGIPTTRALAALATGEQVQRGRTEPGGILARVATSHVRVGTFEYVARQDQGAAVGRLADYVIRRHYPHLDGEGDRHLKLLEEVSIRTADLMASWLLVGFIHGVMNTDNTSIVGETLDYGPFGFLDGYRPGEVYSSIDLRGRYAYGEQPRIALWNLSRFGETLLPLLDPTVEAAVERAQEVLKTFPARFQESYHNGLLRKVGLVEGREGDVELARDLLARMATENADMTATFRALSKLDRNDATRDRAVRTLFDTPAAFDTWAEGWRARLAVEARPEEERQADMASVNPAFILRNHLAQEAADAAVERLDFGPMERLLSVLSRPFDDQPEHADLARPPAPDQRVTRTFCGT